MTGAAGVPGTPPPEVRDDLVGRLLDHCGYLCVTGDEAPIADAMVARYSAMGEAVIRVGNSVVVGSPPPLDGSVERRPLVLLVGHLDVVPPTDDDRDPRVATRDGEQIVIARGASDMKAGNVIGMQAFEDAAMRSASPYEMVLVLYAGEEGPQETNELRDVLDAVPWLRQADLAVVLEPTDGQVQLGCLGGLQAEVTFIGQQAHSARPWHGRNALTMAGRFLDELDRDHLRDVDVDGIRYRDVWSATQAWTPGLGPTDARPTIPARNIIPGTFTINLNFRFAPSRTMAEAEAELLARVGDLAEVTIVDRAPAAPPRMDAPLVRAFTATVAATVAAKQAWTDVAQFAFVGVPALNYGPGLTAQAHQRGEYVRVDDLVDSHARLRHFLTGS